MRKLTGIVLFTLIAIYIIFVMFTDKHLYIYSFDNYKIFDVALNLCLFIFVLISFILLKVKVKSWAFVVGFILACYHISDFISYSHKYKAVYKANDNSTIVLRSYNAGALGSGLVNVVVYQKNGLLLEPKSIGSYEHVRNGEITKHGDCCIKISMINYDNEKFEDIIILD